MHKICTSFILLICSVMVRGEDISFRDGYDLTEPNALNGHLSISLSTRQTKVKIGEAYNIEFRITNLGGGLFLFNPFLNGRFMLPAQLAIFDSNQTYLGDVLSSTIGDNHGTGQYSWAYVPPDTYSGGVKLIMAGRVGQTEWEHKGHYLPEGDYYLQLICMNAMGGRDSKAEMVYGPGQAEQVAIHFDRTELFRSNLVKVHYVNGPPSTQQSPSPD